MDELQRYIEYLQRSKLTPGSELAHDTVAFRQWVETNRAQLEKIAIGVGGTSELVDELERRLSSMNPASVFDSFTARAIFEPLLAEVLAAASEAALAPIRGVVFANLTDTSPSAAAIPSSSDHLLFAGVGTYAFCNYWAKAIAGIATEYHRRFGSSPFTHERLREFWSAESALLINAARLALYCRAFGSLVGFRTMPAVPEESPFRIEILLAMEVFAIAHEVGHCYIEEKNPNRSPSANDEFACDFYALLISRTGANHWRSWAAFSGAGAYVFLRAAAVSAQPQQACQATDVSTHPTPHERAAAVAAAIITNTSEDQVAAVKAYLRDFEILFDELDAVVEKEITNETWH